MRAIIVTGDRHAHPSTSWFSVVNNAIRAQSQDGCPLVVIHGDAKGIDFLAGDAASWMAGSGVQCIPVPAQWDKHGRAAGPRRNEAMLRMLLILQDHGYDVRVYAFHDDLNGSKGTKNMAEIARKAGVVVRLFRSNGESEVLP